VKGTLLNLLIAPSLLLCVAVVAIWIRSCFRQDFVYYHRDGYLFEFTHAHGMVKAGWGQYSNFGLAGWQLSTRPVLPRAAYQENWMTRDGFSIHHEPQSGSFKGSEMRVLVVPYWAILGAFAVAPTWVTLVRIRSDRRRKFRHCPSCGYDLRATPDRCPECGAVTAGSRGEGSLAKPTADEHVHGV
jgi:hypothetical protein